MGYLNTMYQMVIRFKAFSALSLLVFLFTSCDKNRVFEENKEIPKGLWDQNNKVVFNVDVQDTISWHNIYLNVRNAGSYPFSNLFVFITTQSPKGHTVRDTVECTLSDEKGKWLGDGIGDLWDNQLLFKRMVRFPMKGIYKVQMEQAMRVNPLPFIMDVGLRVEKLETTTPTSPQNKEKHN